MIANVRLRGLPCFADETTLGPLKAITFVFGPNGSGKTTISRVLAHPTESPSCSVEWERPSDPGTVSVYNRDFVEDALASPSSLPGVFYLGEGSAEALAELEGIAGAGGKLELARGRLNGLTDTLRRKEEELELARVRLEDASWVKRDSIPNSLSPMWEGTRSSKRVFSDKLLAVANGQLDDVPSVEALEALALSVFDESAAAAAVLDLVPALNLTNEPGASLLNAAIVGSEDAPVATLIAALGNADWVREGVGFLELSESVCPFCQQPVPPGLGEHLVAYFDEAFDAATERLEALATKVSLHIASAEAILDVAAEASVAFIDQKELRAARDDLERATRGVLSVVQEKLKATSRPVTLPQVRVQEDAVNSLLSTANERIEAHNRALERRLTERPDLVERSWRYFAARTAAVEIATYRAEVDPLRAACEAVREKIVEATTSVGEFQRRIVELHRGMRSTRPAIDEINAMLRSVGLTSFSIEESRDVENAYSLVRDGVRLEGKTLSEGERTFVTFMYFVLKLEGRATDQPRVAVIDDPVSSLDSEILFVVSHLIRRLIRTAAAGTQALRQVIVLTHNAYFHREVTYRRRGDPEGVYTFAMIDKHRDSGSTIAIHESSQVVSAYQDLWRQVAVARAQPSSHLGGLPNVMRRIVEHYFAMLGGVKEDELLERFEGTEQQVCRSLFGWMHQGSHTIIDDLDHSPAGATAALYLDVFERLFREAGQDGHFEMMIKSPS